MASFELTRAQCDFVATFGYLHLPGLLSERIGAIERAFDDLRARRGLPPTTVANGSP